MGGWTQRARQASSPRSTTSSKQEADSQPKALSDKEMSGLVGTPSNLSTLEGIWYSVSTKEFWRFDQVAGWISYNKDDFRAYLSFCGIPTKRERWQNLSAADSLIVRIQHHRRLDYAGEVAGYPRGIHKICGKDILIPRGPEVLKPRRGAWPTFRKLISQLLGDDGVWLYSWLSSAYKSMIAGPPFRPGQLMVIAGPGGCGKSFLQNLLTHVLGGRSCKPYAYLIGKTAYNDYLCEAEHWMIEDDADDTSFKTRRLFGQRVKNCLVNETMDWQGKFLKGMSVSPFIRLTMTCNDNPEALMVLPAITEDLADKITILKAKHAPVCDVGENLERRQKLKATLLGELPAFLGALLRWEVPKEHRCTRYGVRAYQNRDLLDAVNQLSPESRLLSLVDQSDLFGTMRLQFLGTAFEVEQRLRSWDKAGEVARLLSYTSACGIYLSRLAKQSPERVEITKERKGNQNVYAINPIA